MTAALAVLVIWSPPAAGEAGTLKFAPRVGHKYIYRVARKGLCRYNFSFRFKRGRGNTWLLHGRTSNPAVETIINAEYIKRQLASTKVWLTYNSNGTLIPYRGGLKFPNNADYIDLDEITHRDFLFVRYPHGQPSSGMKWVETIDGPEFWTGVMEHTGRNQPVQIHFSIDRVSVGEPKLVTISFRATAKLRVGTPGGEELDTVHREGKYVIDARDGLPTFLSRTYKHSRGKSSWKSEVALRRLS